MKKRLFLKKCIALVSLLSLTACGNKPVPVEAPVLMDYVYGGDITRPVGYEITGEQDVWCGTVIPAQTCYYLEEDSVLSRINVAIGDYVKKGDVLATTQVADDADLIAGQQALIRLTKDMDECDRKIEQARHHQLEFDLAWANEQGDKDAAKEILTAIAEMDVDIAYNEIYREKKLQEENKVLADYRDGRNKGTLRTEQDGYVTYVRDIQEGIGISKFENLVIVSDYEHPVIELFNTEYSSRTLKEFGRYDAIYTYVDGVRCDLEIVPVEEDARIFMANSNAFLTIKLQATDGRKLSDVGEDVPVYFEKGDMTPVLFVGSDSVVRDNGETFVYVQTDAGREYRKVKLGKRTFSGYQVLEGLSEGENVYYSTNCVQPDYEDIVTIDYSAVPFYVKSTSSSSLPAIAQLYFAEQNGRMIEVFKEVGDEVEKGDLIFTMQTERSGSTLKNVRDQISTLEEQERLRGKQFDKQMEDMDKQIDTAKAYEGARQSQLNKLKEEEEKKSASEESSEDPEEGAGEDPEDEEPEIDYISTVNPYGSASLSERKAELISAREKEKLYSDYCLNDLKKKLKKLSADNDGTGVVSVYAEESGVLSEFRPAENIQIGDKIFKITSKTEREIIVYSSVPLAVGSRVSFEHNGDEPESFSGTVIGNRDENTLFLNRSKGKYVMTGTPTEINYKLRYLVRLDEGAEYDTNKSYNVICVSRYVFHAFSIPYRAMFSEKIEAETYHFVWKLVDGRLVKQYVENNTYCMPDDNQNDAETISPYIACVLHGLQPGDLIVSPDAEWRHYE